MTDASAAPRRRRLPDVALTSLSGGTAVPLREHRRTAVVVVLDRAPSERDVEYLRQLADADAVLRDWDARVLVIAAGSAASALRPTLDAVGLPFPVLADPGRVVATAAGVDGPALVVADQWGEVHVAAPSGPQQPWLAVGEVEQWARFLAVRCAG